MIIVVVLIVIVFFPKYFEKLLRKNHYKSKDNIVQKYIIPNLNSSKILDFGSGSGALNHSLKSKINCDILSVDIKDTNEYGDSPLIYDGKTLPIRDNDYDVVICLFVLHHIPNQLNILDELIRVCGKRLIIMEDCKDTIIDNCLTYLHGFSSYGKCHDCFHSSKEWEQIFREKRLKIKDIVDIPRSIMPIYPVCRKLFVLDKF